MTQMLDNVFLNTALAHRGLHDPAQGIFENSRSAFQAAIDHGFGIELDLQLSRDGQAVVFHDETLDRMTGHTGLVVDHTIDELAQIELGTSHDHIETLPQILDFVAGRVPLLIEIKDQSGNFGKTNGVLERATCDALASYRGPVAVMSFNPNAIAHVQTHAPHLVRGLTTGNFASYDLDPADGIDIDGLTQISRFDELGACFISHDRNDLANPAVRQLKSRGIPVLCWTIRSVDQETTARKIADNITFEGYLPSPS